MSRFILAHDLGTSGNKATLYDFEGHLLSSTVFEYPTYYPEHGWVEQDPEDWWKAVCISNRELMEKACAKKRGYSLCYLQRADDRMPACGQDGQSSEKVHNMGRPEGYPAS